MTVADGLNVAEDRLKSDGVDEVLPRWLPNPGMYPWGLPERGFAFTGHCVYTLMCLRGCEMSSLEPAVCKLLRPSLRPFATAVPSCIGRAFRLTMHLFLSLIVKLVLCAVSEREGYRHPIQRY